MTSEKKYPCLFGLVPDCGARRYVEENVDAPPAYPGSEAAEALEKALKATKALPFDDEQTAKREAEAVAKGFQPLIQSMRPSKPQLLSNYCTICPTLRKFGWGENSKSELMK